MTNARYVYSELASAIQARQNCSAINHPFTTAEIKSHCAVCGQIDSHSNHQMKNPEWFDRWSDYIDLLMEQMPSGSGFDSGTKIDLDASHAEKLVITTSYHHMHESGMYDGWTDHTVTVTPSFSGINIRISGRNRNDIKEYMHDTFYQALMDSVEIHA